MTAYFSAPNNWVYIRGINTYILKQHKSVSLWKTYLPLMYTTGSQKAPVFPFLYHKCNFIYKIVDNHQKLRLIIR